MFLPPLLLLPGAGADYSGPRPSPDDVAHETLRVMRRCVPPALPGIMFLSGGQVGWGLWGLRPKRSGSLHSSRLCANATAGAVPACVQTEEEATVNLNRINQLAQQQGRAPWALSFSFGRSLQASVLKLWSEDPSGNRQRCRDMAAALAQANSQAVLGRFEGPHPSVTSQQGSLRESFRGWRTDV